MRVMDVLVVLSAGQWRCSRRTPTSMGPVRIELGNDEIGPGDPVGHVRKPDSDLSAASVWPHGLAQQHV